MKLSALRVLLRGMTAETIALSIAVGFVLGVFPVWGCPTIFCALAALVLRLNLPAIQLVNYLVYPLQLALLVPLIRLGDWLFHPAASPHPWGILAVLTAALHAAAAWFCVCVPLGLLLYLFLICVLRRRTAHDI